MARPGFLLGIFKRVRRALICRQPILSFLWRPSGRLQHSNKHRAESRISKSLAQLHSFIYSRFPTHWIIRFWPKSSKSKTSSTKLSNPMDKILLKQAARIIDHLVENKDEDIDWALIDRFQDLLEKHLNRSTLKMKAEQNAQKNHHPSH